MNGQRKPDDTELVDKIARLVEERGWNQEDFARRADLNRLTVRRIMQRREGTRLRNSTVGRCARALSVAVDDLRNAPIAQLLSPRGVKTGPYAEVDAKTRRLYEQAMQPELQAWLQRNPERAARLTHDEMDELLSLQGTGGPHTRLGVEHFVGLVERKRKLIDQVHAIAGTEFLDVLEKIVQLIYEKIQPYGDPA
jgi:transcriptional regulator with XRE-family HTH domain